MDSYTNQQGDRKPQGRPVGMIKHMNTESKGAVSATNDHHTKREHCLACIGGANAALMSKYRRNKKHLNTHISIIYCYIMSDFRGMVPHCGSLQ